MLEIIHLSLRQIDLLYQEKQEVLTKVKRIKKELKV